MRLTLALIFFLSGASALIFESLWFRLAGLSLGNSVWSASLVLAAFMGGLALGNALVARLHRRVSHPIRLYAVLEFAIGFAGIAVVLILPHLPAMLGPALGNLSEMPLLLNAVRLSIAFGILLIPAVAMGATLPVLVHALSRRNENFGANVGWLYGWNTFGAMLGVIGAELALVPLFGIVNSGLIALVLNMIAALIAVSLSREHEKTPIVADSVPDESLKMGTRSRRYIAVAFLSGALMLALEVVWFRFLLLTRDGTGLIFAVMLAVVLAGIALGGLIAALLFRQDDRAYRWLRHVTAVSAALVVLTYWGYDLFAVYSSQQDITTMAFIGLATFLMIPVAVLSGIAFTMVNRAVKDELGSSARTAGIATFYNTTGAMLGSLLAGFVLLPFVGMELSFFLIAVAYGIVAFVVPSEDQSARTLVLWARGTAVAALACLVLFPFGLMERTYFSGELTWLPNHELVESREGLTETIRYYRRDAFGEPKYYRLVTNGHSMSATSTASQRYMKLYVYLPIALNPNSRNALLVSYGVGQTAKALSDTAQLERIDIVDISEDVLEMNSIVFPDDDNPLHDDRVNVHVEDGRFFLNSTDTRYDLITSEPPPPKLAGVVNLYSQEYFELIRSRLNPGGFVSYWLPVQQLDQMDTLAIIRGFCNAFEDCSLWSGAGLEWMLIGSNGADSAPSLSAFSAQWTDPVVAEELIAVGLESPAQMGSLFMADADLLMSTTEYVKPVVDNYPARISRALVEDQGYIELYDWLMHEGERVERFRNSPLIARLWPEELVEQAEPYFDYERLIKNHFTAGVYAYNSDPYLWEAIDGLLSETSLTTLPLWLLGSDRDVQDIIAGLLDRDGYRTEFALELARKYASERDYETALMYVSDHIVETDDVSLWASNFYLYLLARNGRTEEAEALIAQLDAGQEEIDRFVGWFTERFELGDAAILEATLQ